MAYCVLVKHRDNFTSQNNRRIRKEALHDEGRLEEGRKEGNAEEKEGQERDEGRRMRWREEDEEEE
jgi:hypothetical protein